MNTNALTGSAFKTILPISANMLARKFNIKVEFGHRPATDGNVIYLPTIPMEVDDETSTLVFGHMYHEMSHIMFTDFPVWNAGVKDFQNDLCSNSRQLGKSIFNAIEDPRIEAAGARAYLGGKRFLESSLAVMYKRGEVVKPSSSPANALLCYLLGRGNQLVMKYSLPAEAEALAESTELVKEMLGDAGFKRLDVLMQSEFPQMRSTRDALNLSIDVLSLLKEIEQEQKDEQQKDQPQESGNAGEGEGESSDQNNPNQQQDDDGDQGSDTQGQGQPNDSAEQDNQGSASQNQGESSDGADGEGSSKTTGAGQILDCDDVADKVVDLSSAMSDAIKDEIEQQADKGQLETTDSTEIRFASGMDLPKNQDRYNQLAAEARMSIGVVQRVLESISALSRLPTYRGGSRGKLNPKKLHRAQLGDLNIFRKKMDIKSRSNAVALLVDLSGSMAGIDAKQALMAAIAVAEACDRASIPCAIYGFQSELFLLKSYDEPMVQARARIGAAEQLVGGGTNMGPALYEAGISMFEREEERKLLITVTDGAPSNPTLVNRMVALMEKSGVETFGLGIQSKAVQHYFPKSAVIHSSEEIGPAVFEVLNKYLLGKTA